MGKIIVYNHIFLNRSLSVRVSSVRFVQHALPCTTFAVFTTIHNSQVQGLVEMFYCVSSNFQIQGINIIFFLCHRLQNLNTGAFSLLISTCQAIGLYTTLLFSLLAAAVGIGCLLLSLDAGEMRFNEH